MGALQGVEETGGTSDALICGLAMELHESFHLFAPTRDAEEKPQRNNPIPLTVKVVKLM